jgi:hypothetical protein
VHWKAAFKEATEKSGINQEDMQEILVSIQKNSRASVVGGQGLPGARSGRDKSGGGMLSDVIQKADKGQLGSMLVSLKDAYDILSNHHDRVLENLEKFQGDMEFKMDEITDLNWEIKTLKRRIEKGPDGKKSVMLDENGKEIPKDTLAKNNARYLRFQAHERKDARFSKYMDNDFQTYQDQVKNFATKSFHPGMTFESRDLSELLLGDLKKKGRPGNILGDQEFMESDFKKKGSPQIGSMMSISGLGTVDGTIGQDLKAGSGGNIGKKIPARGVNATPEGRGGPPSKIAKAILKTSTGAVRKNTVSGNKVLSRGGLRNTPNQLSTTGISKKDGSRNNKSTLSVNSRDGSDSRSLSQDQEFLYKSPTTQNKTRRQRADKKQTRGLRPILGSEPEVSSSSEDENLPPAELKAKKTKKLLRRNSVVDENAVEGSKLVGFRSEQYQIDRGGTTIRCNDMGIGTAISGDDMAMGITVIKPEVLMGSAGNDASGNPVAHRDLNDILPNVKVEVVKNKLTGAIENVFKLVSGHVLRVCIDKGPDLDLGNKGLRGLVSILCRDLGVEDLFSVSGQAQLMEIQSVLKDSRVISIIRSNPSLDSAGLLRHASFRDENPVEGADLFDDDDSEYGDDYAEESDLNQKVQFLSP